MGDVLREAVQAAYEEVLSSRVRDSAGRFLTARWLSPAELQQRIFDRVFPEPNSGCWLWIGALNKWGYGSAYANGKNQFAHRVAYEAYNETSIPAGMQIDHKCRTPLCVNPDHLELVTPRVNWARSRIASRINAQKTHCDRGHALSGDNLYTDKRGKRYCRKCRALIARRRRAAARIEKERGQP